MNLNNDEKKKLVKDDYNAIAGIYSSEDKNIKFYSAYIDKFLNNLKGNAILDTCCGSGEYSQYFADKNKQVVGVDFSSELIKIAKSKYKNVTFIEKDICNFVYKQKFDGIFSKDALFHLPDEDIDTVIQNFYKMLNLEGKLFLILDIPKEAGEKIYKEPLDNRFSLYYNYLTVEKVKTILQKNGFKIDAIEIVGDSDYEYAQGVMFVYASKCE